MTLAKFKKLIGGRINYSKLHKYCITIEYDFFLFKTFIKYRSLGYDNWKAANEFRNLLPRLDLNGMKYNFSAYNNYFINRFYKIRKAIKISSISYDFQTNDNLTKLKQL